METPLAKKQAVPAALLTRGQIAAESGCHIETVRYYEQIGLMPLPRRGPGGWRLYDKDLLKRLSFLRRCRELGFTLQEIRGLLRLVDGRRITCSQVEAVTRDHARSIQRKVADLNRIKKVLDSMAARCSGGTVPECPIIDALFDARVCPSAPRDSSRPGRVRRRG
jgi:MerR family mercuric resistance operon transcriptional regulator